MEPTQGLINWILVVVFTNLAAIGTAILAFVKASKMIPKEVEGAELDNRGKEASVADQFNTIAVKAAEQAVALQSRLTTIEKDYGILKTAHEKLAQTVVEQEATIKEQSRTIENNAIRLQEQETKMCEQEEIINELKFDLNVAQQYNSELITQMKAKNLIPIEPPKRKYSKRNSKEKPE